MNDSGKQFDGILDDYFERLLADVPTFAVVSGGLAEGEGRLGRADAAFHKRREAARQKTLQRLDQISPGTLSKEQHLDRLALRTQLLRETEDFSRNRHEIDPGGAEQILSILFHELQRADDEPERAAANLRRLLKQVPGFLEGAGETLKTPEPVWLKIMEETVSGAESLLGGVRKVLEASNPRPQDDAMIASTQKALEGYRDHASSLPPAPDGSFALGAAGMQRRVRDELGLDYTLGQIEALAVAEADRVGGLLQKACAAFGRNRSAEEIISTLRSEWHPGRPLLEFYRTETTRIASAFKQAGAVTFPKGDELDVRPVPEFLRSLIPTAAYSQPGAFAKRQRGIFWVNDLSLTKESAAEKLAEQQQHFGMSLTCAHEAYPGHHLQFVTANQHPRRWRRLFAHAVFYEGWTLWCEQMMMDLQIDSSPWLPVQQLHDALWRCHRILVDLRLQTGRYSHAQATRHLQKHLGFTRARASADVNWYTGQPGVPMSYWLGRLEVARLHAKLVQGRGWEVQRFNDWLLSFGTIPQAWIEKYGLD